MTTLLGPSPSSSPAPVPESRPSRTSIIVGRTVTALLVIGPVVALAIAVPFLWGHAITLQDMILAAVFYVVSGFGVTVGYHRLFAHRSFRAARWLKIVLAAAGSMAMEGSVVGWVANHRRHHVFSDKPGDPHSPHLSGTGAVAQLRGFAHAHVGWLFKVDTTSAAHYAPELMADVDTQMVSRLFPVFAIGSLAAPFFIGWTLSGAIGGALTGLLWAGLARMMLLHHVTWSVNSICHMFGKQPATQKDHSTNFAPLAIISFGESWHNFHHAHPASARHGALPHQIDPSAALIRLFERAGWATQVRWPTMAQLALCRTG
jgi:stearoyl-CoA desaturase (delta-9 desaturase)